MQTLTVVTLAALVAALPGLGALIVPMGITTLTLLIATLVVGLLVKKRRRPLLRIHITLAILTLASALFHAAVVFLFLL